MSPPRRRPGWGAKERRREERRPAPQVSIESPALEVTLCDTSDTGLGIEAERPLKVGVVYPFKLRRGTRVSEVYGLVRWCQTVRRDRFRAGVTVGKTVGASVSSLSAGA